MTENELFEALAEKLADYDEGPLGGCEVRIFPQVDYRNETGFVCIAFEETGGQEIPIGIGDNFADEIMMTIRGAIPLADTEANRRELVELCQQMRLVLRTNRRLVVGDEKSEANGDISWRYKLAEEGQRVYRVCDVRVTYRIAQEATS